MSRTPPDRRWRCRRPRPREYAAILHAEHRRRQARHRPDRELERDHRARERRRRAGARRRRCCAGAACRSPGSDRPPSLDAIVYGWRHDVPDVVVGHVERDDRRVAALQMSIAVASGVRPCDRARSRRAACPQRRGRARYEAIWMTRRRRAADVLAHWPRSAALSLSGCDAPRRCVRSAARRRPAAAPRAG